MIFLVYLQSQKMKRKIGETRAAQNPKRFKMENL